MEIRTLRYFLAVACRDDRAARTAGPRRAVQHGRVRAVPAQREGPGRRNDGDVRAGRLHAEGRAYHGGALRRGLQRGDRQLPDVGAGREAGEIREAEAGGGISVSYSGREIREGQDRRVRPVTGWTHSLGIEWDGRREVLAVELAHRESTSIWKDFLD